MLASRTINTMDASDLSDEELACHAQAGSLVAFELLVQRYDQKLLRHLRGRTGGEQDAEDIRQETFAKAYRNMHRYDPSRSFSTWLFTIAVRLAASCGRGRRDWADIDGMDIAAGGPGPAQEAADSEAAVTLWAIARRDLPENQYCALWQRYAQGLSVREVSRRMGLTRIHVKVLLHRARKKLMTTLPPGAAGQPDPPHRAPGE